MKVLILVCIILLFASCSHKQISEKDLFSEATLKSEREKFYNNTINQTILESLSLPLNDSTEKKYLSAFWAMELIQFRNQVTDSAIKISLDEFESRSTEFQRALLELIYALYQDEFVEEVETLVPKINNPKLFAMCIHYLKNSIVNDRLLQMTYDFESKFMKAAEDPIIKMLKLDIENNFRKNLASPQLLDLFKNKFLSNQLVIFSIQRVNREFPGLLVIKTPEGKFLRTDKGEIFSIPQLARAVSGLPGYITNGNTPEGFFSIQGIDVSKNVFIGLTPNLQLVLPFEVKPSFYFHNKITDSVWQFEFYDNLIPQSWKNHYPIYEAYFAGKAGRNEIIAHGTTINPEYYKDKSYFPFTPSLGCLTTNEIWSDKTGQPIESDQIKLINTLMQFKSLNGFFVVVNIDNKNSPVELKEIENIILQAEGSL